MIITIIQNNINKLTVSKSNEFIIIIVQLFGAPSILNSPLFPGLKLSFKIPSAIKRGDPKKKSM